MVKSLSDFAPAPRDGTAPGLSRVEHERMRALNHLKRLRTIVDQVISDLEKRAPIPGPDVAQAVAHTGIDVARSLSMLDAYDIAAQDAVLRQGPG